MAGTIKGINIVIGGDTGPLTKALEGVNKKTKDLQSELKQVERLLKLDPGNTELIAQKQKLLAEAVENTGDKLKTLKTAQQQVEQQFKSGNIGEEQYRAFQREIVKTEQELKGLETQSKKTSKSLAETFDNIGSKFTSAGQKASIASAAIAAGVGAAAKSAMDAADGYVKLSDETGLSLKSIQEYAYIGGQVGVELDTIAGAQAKLTKSMSAARGGNGTQAEAFKALGVSVTDSNGQLRDAKTVMGEAFSALNQVGNETERDALSMAIFGKSAMDLNPMIKLGADGMEDMRQKAKDLGIVMSDESIKSLDDFGDSMEGLKMSVMGAVGESLAPFIEKITELIKWFSGLSDGTKGTILAILGIVAVVGPLLIIIGALIGAVTTIAGAFAAASGAIAAAGGVMAVLTGPIGIAVAAILGMIAVGALLMANWDKIKDKIGAVAEFIKTQIERIKGFFAGLKIELPKIKLPHFAITGKFSINPPQAPSFGVNWYDSGGIFNNPSIIGVGEKRPEFVGALDDLRKIVREESGGGTINHTGTITVKGVNNQGELVAVVEQSIMNNIVIGNRRIPNKTSLIPIG